VWTFPVTLLDFGRRENKEEKKGGRDGVFLFICRGEGISALKIALSVWCVREKEGGGVLVFSILCFRNSRKGGRRRQRWTYLLFLACPTPEKGGGISICLLGAHGNVRLAGKIGETSLSYHFVLEDNVWGKKKREKNGVAYPPPP